jgi:hypothetical protein
LSGVDVVVVEGGTGPVLVAAWLLPAPAPPLGAGQEMPAAAEAEEDPVCVGVEDPPQAVAKRATPMPSAVSLAARGAAGERSNIRCLLDRKVRTAFDAITQVFLIKTQTSAIDPGR